MKPFSYFILVSALATNSIAWAEQTSKCSQIENKNERLLCFDREFPDITQPKRPREAKAKASELISNESEAATAATSTLVESEAPSKNKSRFSFSGLLDWKEPFNFETEIAAIRSGGKQRMVFRLDNGQIWMQTSPRELPFSVGNKVAIKSGKMGGFIMRSESGTSTRVRRIE